MGEYTPGPWAVDTTKAFGPYNILTISEDVPQKDCIVCSFHRDRRASSEDRPRLEADAALISAAPDLLAVCEALIRAVECRGEDPVYVVTSMARAAVRKARGERTSP